MGKVLHKDALVRARVNEKRKIKVASILEKLGMNHSEAINLFYAQIELQKGLPFPVKIPNALTKETLKKSNLGEEVEEFDTKKALLEDLGL